MEDSPVTRTFRIEREYDEALRDEADSQGTSVNSLANQILKKYTNSDRYFRIGQSITVSPRTLDHLTKYLLDEEIAKVGKRSGSEIPKDQLTMRGLPINRQTVEWFILEVLVEYNNWFTADMHEKDNTTTIYIRHFYGRKWSIFLESYFNAMLEALLGIKDPVYEVTDVSVSFTL
jgi:hypothetical protein